eukprot:877-Heterococcus_DN1.PRE.4
MHQGRSADRRHCYTAEDYCRVFAELCFTTVHWEALRKLFVDMLLHSPYVEYSLTIITVAASTD